jgi:hypothetical protein
MFTLDRMSMKGSVGVCGRARLSAHMTMHRRLSDGGASSHVVLQVVWRRLVAAVGRWVVYRMAGHDDEDDDDTDILSLYFSYYICV